MLSATLEAGLSDYAIGAKIRALRLKKKMGLVELGRHSGLSPALLSKLERGRLFPTLPTLLRIALVFSVGLRGDVTLAQFALGAAASHWSFVLGS
jgi:transcriptional regulator with XRE-family HTH domain